MQSLVLLISGIVIYSLSILILFKYVQFSIITNSFKLKI